MVVRKDPFKLDGTLNRRSKCLPMRSSVQASTYSMPRFMHSTKWGFMLTRFQCAGIGADVVGGSTSLGPVHLSGSTPGQAFSIPDGSGFAEIGSTVPVMLGADARLLLFFSTTVVFSIVTGRRIDVVQSSV